MKLTETALPDVFLIEPKVFGDARGFFFESFRQDLFDEAVGRKVSFVQDNHSRSAKHVLRGMHWQRHDPQGKLVRVVRGRVYDVAVDLRRSSPHFGKYVGYELSEENQRQLWVPEGFAHGFVVLSDSADFVYKTTSYYAPAHERCLAWNDPTVDIDWPLEGAQPALSAKDQLGKSLAEADAFD